MKAQAPVQVRATADSNRDENTHESTFKKVIVICIDEKRAN